MIKGRKDYERNLYVLLEGMKNGKVKFSHNVRKNVKGLMDVRKTPNCRVNMLTIDEAARLTANSISMMDTERFKKNSESEP